MTTTKIPAVIMAGGKAKPDFQAATGLENRALLEVGGRTMLQTVADVLASCDRVGAIVVVGDLPNPPHTFSVRDGGGFVENVFGGLDAFPDDDYVLLCTSDIPFVTAEVIADYLERARELNADLVYPIVPLEACYQRFPGMKRTALKLREGQFTGGNMMLVRSSFMRRQREQIAGAYAARKQPLKLAMMIGIGTLVKVLLAQLIAPRLLPIADLERGVSRLLGGNLRAYISPFPEIATDVDRPEDLAALNVGG